MSKISYRNNIRELTKNFTSIVKIPLEVIDQLWIEDQYVYCLNNVYDNCFKNQTLAMLEKLAFYHIIWSSPEMTTVNANLKKLWCIFAAEAVDCNPDAKEFLNRQQLLAKKFFTQLNPFNNNHERLKTVRIMFQNAFSKFRVSPPNYFDYIKLEEEKRNKDIQSMEIYLYRREFFSEQVTKELDKLAINYLIGSSHDTMEKYAILQEKREAIATRLVTEEIDDGKVFSETNQTCLWQLYLENLNK